MKNKGITLIALVITIIVLLILAGISLSLLLGENGILIKARESKIAYEKAAIKETIEMESTALNREREEVKLGKRTDREVFGILQSKLEEKPDLKDTNYLTKSKFMMITTKQGYIYTVLYDGTVLEGKYALLDIADGTIIIDPKSKSTKGYQQDTDMFIEYDGKYIITGQAIGNYVRIEGKDTYDITIKDLSIDMRNLANGCPFNANGGANETDCFVNLKIDGDNHFYGGSCGAGLGFTGGKPNINGVVNGSTLTITGKGNLEAKGGIYSAGIGSGYGYAYNNNALGQVSNIIINSGNIRAIGGSNGAGIGSCLGGTANNIVINNGNIYATGSKGIGTGDNIVINGGKLEVILGEATIGINGGKIRIKGGEITIIDPKGWYYEPAIWGSEILIEGGKIKTVTGRADARAVGMLCNSGGTIKIIGGNIMIRSNNKKIATYEEGTTNLIAYTPTNGTNDLYVTPIKLQDVDGNKKIESLITSDNIDYGIKDMYTFEDDTATTSVNETGMIYLYLPLGSRTITVKVDGQSYSGTVETTSEESEVITLNKI